MNSLTNTLVLFLFIPILSGQEIAGCLENIDLITNLLLQKPFYINNVILLQPNPSDFNDKQVAKLAKTFFKRGNTFGATKSYIKAIDISSVVICANDNSSLEAISEQIARHKLGVRKPTVVLYKTQIQTLVDIFASKIRIDQEVYFVKLDSQSVHEMYSVNNVNIVNVLGHWKRLKWLPGQAESFYKRRRNLQGTHLKVMVERDPTYTQFDPNFESTSKFHKENQTYEITSARGIAISILRSFAEHLNVTYTMFKRKDGTWGSSHNGKPTGMSQNIYEGSADLVAAPFGVTLERFQFVGYLPVMFYDSIAIFIRNDISEELGTVIFLATFDPSLWLVLTLAALIFGCWFSISSDSTNQFKGPKILSRFLHFVQWLWSAMTVNVGGKLGTWINPACQISDKITILSCLLVGQIIWIAYRASLTSQLSVVKTKYPFSNLETLLQTDYLLMTGSVGTVIGDSFAKAKPGSIEQRVLENNMDLDRSFNFSAIHEVVESSEKLAFYYSRFVVLGPLPDKCKILKVWQKEKPSEFYSFAIPKNSTYARFLKFATVEFLERGPLGVEKARALPSEAPCLPPAVYPFSLKKIWSVFLFLSIGYIFALTVLICEISSKTIESKSGALIAIGHQMVILRALLKKNPGHFGDNTVYELSKLKVMIRNHVKRGESAN